MVVITVEKILKDLDTAYRTLSQIPVSGDSVDAMAVARAQLRGVYAELEKLNNDKTEKH